MTSCDWLFLLRSRDLVGVFEPQQEAGAGGEEWSVVRQEASKVAGPDQGVP